MPEITKPNYYAILPAEVRYFEGISASAKLLYAEISSLTNLTKHCWASNSYFAKLYNVNKDSVSRWIAELSEFGFIKIKLDDRGGRQICLGVSAKMPRGVGKNADHNNKVNKELPKGSSLVDLERGEGQILDMINSVTGRSFRTLPRGSAKTLKLFSQNEIGQALYNMKNDPWHKDKIASLSLDYMLRASVIDKFLSLQTNVPARGYA